MALAGSATISWLAPTENTDGTPLTDLAGYRLFSGCVESGTYEREPVTIADPGVTSYVIGELPDSGTCYFAATAFNAAGNESGFSNQATTDFGPLALPDDPTEPPVISWASAMNVLLVVANAGAPTTGDSALSTLIQAHGHTVTLRTASDAENITGQDAVFVAESVSSGNVGTKYRDVAIPVVLLEPFLTDEYLIATGQGQISFDQITILDESEALAGGLTEAGSPHDITDAPASSNRLGFLAGTIASGFVAVANSTMDAAPTVGYIPSGGALTTGNAPALRVLVLFHDLACSDLSAAGEAIINAAVDMIEAEIGGGSVPTEINAGVDALVLSALAADVALDVDIAAGTDSLAISEQSATVNLSKSIAAALETLTITELGAAIALDVDIAAGQDTLTLTEFAATLAVGKTIAAGVDILSLSTLSADVALDVNVSAAIDALQITEFGAAIAKGKSIQAAAAELGLTVLAANVALDTDISALADSLELTELQATVELVSGFVIEAGTQQLSITGYRATIQSPSSRSGQRKLSISIGVGL